MLWVWSLQACKSNTWYRLTEVLEPSEITVEKPTESCVAQSLMRPATSSALTALLSYSAMMARSARMWARSARVPVVWVSTNTGWPLPRWAVGAASSRRAWLVWFSGEASLAPKTAMFSGCKRGGQSAPISTFT